MASHLSVTTSAGPARTSFTGQAEVSGAPASLLDAFATLLNGSGPAPEASATEQSSFTASLGGLPELALELDSDAKPDDPDPVATMLDLAAIQPQPLPAPSADLGALLDSLGNIASSLEAGQPPAPADLQAATTALSRLAATLGIPLDAAPDAQAAAAANAPPPADSFAGQLATALAPLAQALRNANSEATPAAQQLGHQLTALLQELGSNDATEPLAGPAATTIEASLAKLGRAGLKLTQAEPQFSTAASLAALAEQPADTQQPDGASPDGGAEAPDADANDIKAEGPALSTKSNPAAEAILAPNHAAAGNRADLTPATPRPVQPGYQTSQQQLNLPQLAFELVHQANEGNSRFQIRLDPPELGRIEVKLDFDAAGQVTARLTVDKSETLDLMQRDQRGLERALQQAGLDAGKTNLEFSLRQNPFLSDGQGQGNPNGQAHPGSRGFTPASSEPDEAPLPSIKLYRGSLAAGGINIIA